jgi:undecaprenyl-diphosphatase
VTLSMKRLAEIDAQWSASMRIAERFKLLRRPAAFFAHSCDSWFWVAGLLPVWIWGNATWKPLAGRLIVLILILATLVMGMKLTIRRQRPAGEWGQIYRQTDPHSFPSGHAARAFLIAITFLTWGPTWLGAILLVWAPLVSLARVGLGVHYLSDVFAGAGLGAMAALAAILLL